MCVKKEGRGGVVRREMCVEKEGREGVVGRVLFV